MSISSVACLVVLGMTGEEVRAPTTSSNASTTPSHLEREGYAFKIGAGPFYSWWNAPSAGLGLNLQAGYFPSSHVGVLVGWAFSGASAPAGVDHDGFRRHDFALEAQFLPLRLWRVSPGVFGHAGLAFANPDGHPGGHTDGVAFGGGLLLELAISRRVAVSLRADNTIAQVGAEAGWYGASTFTGGVALY